MMALLGWFVVCFFAGLLVLMGAGLAWASLRYTGRAGGESVLGLAILCGGLALAYKAVEWAPFDVVMK